MGILPTLSKLSAGLGAPSVQRLRAHATEASTAPPAKTTDEMAGALSADDRTTDTTLPGPCHVAHTRPIRAKRPRPLTGDRLAEVIRRYESGELLRHIATELGVSRTYISRQLAQAGVQTRQHGMSETEVGQAAYLYGSGQSLVVVGRRLGYSGETVRKALMAAGVLMRDRHGRRQ